MTSRLEVTQLGAPLPSYDEWDANQGKVVRESHLSSEPVDGTQGFTTLGFRIQT